MHERPRARPHRAAGQANALARLVRTLGEPDLGPALLDALRLESRFDSALVLLYRNRRRPVAIAEQLQHSLRRNSADAYLAGAYLLDPFYLRARSLEAPAVLRLRDIAPADFRAGDYFASYYKDSNLVDEVNFLVPVQPGTAFAVCLGRARSQPAFRASDMRRFEAWLPLVSAALARHFELAGDWLREADGAVPEDEHDRLEAALGRFGAGVLTPREQEIVQLLLHGESAPEAAERLALSVETVRVHRRNIYEKLEISSLAELFAAAMDSLLASVGRAAEDRPAARP